MRFLHGAAIENAYTVRTAMNASDTHLLKKLALVLLLKLALLLGLWWLFVRDAQVPVDASRAAGHLLRAPALAPGEK